MIGKTVSHYRIVEKLGGGGGPASQDMTLNVPDLKAEAALEIQDSCFTTYYSDGERHLLQAPRAETSPTATDDKGKGERHA